MSRRTVFFVSDQTGVTAETMGHSLLTQFDGLQLRPLTLPFISSPERAREAAQRIAACEREDGVKPIVFATLVDDSLRALVREGGGLFLDFFAAFLGPLEQEFARPSAHASGRAHGMSDLAAYTTRINATNYVLANDDGAGNRDYGQADVILVGVSRSGKTPTCLYMALQYGVYAANYPLAVEDLESARLPAVLVPHRSKLFGLTIQPERLQQIRQERRPNSTYASSRQVQYEVLAALQILEHEHLPLIDTTECSIEEIASRVIEKMGLERRLRP